jgi:hypothetical protein
MIQQLVRGDNSGKRKKGGLLRWDEKEKPQKKKSKTDNKGEEMTTHTAVIFVQESHEVFLAPKKTRRELKAARDEDVNKAIMQVAEYSDEIFEHLRFLEQRLKPEVFYVVPPSFWDDRAELVNWLVAVHNKCGLIHETLFLAINYLDRYLFRNNVEDSELDLFGATSLLLATKYEDDKFDHGTLGNTLVELADETFTSNELYEAESRMLAGLQYDLGWPCPLSFIHRISRADNYEVHVRTLSKYFLDITVMDKRFVGCVPSFIAAGAYCLARLMLKDKEKEKKKEWVFSRPSLLSPETLIDNSRNATSITLVTR